MNLWFCSGSTSPFKRGLLSFVLSGVAEKAIAILRAILERKKVVFDKEILVAINQIKAVLLVTVPFSPL